MSETDRVIVVGAGPVGLVCALKLARAGIPVLQLEAGPDLAEDLRASTFHPPTLDMLEEFGVVKPLIDLGLIAPKWQFRDRESGERAEFDLTLLADVTGHPYRVQAEQYKLTRLLKEVLDNEANAELWFDTTVTGVRQTGDTVEVEATRDGEPVRLTARYAIGADGARSAVRRSLDLGFEGVTYPELFIQASTPFEFRDHLPHMSLINYISDSEEWFVLLRVPGLWRALFPSREGEDETTMISDESLQARLQGVVPTGEPYEIVHRTLYRVHQRVATTYRVGRLLLAGDSAHLNNPLGGMGMNGGIHDAFNLCEKLIRVWRGEDDALLDAYTRQRQPIAVEYVQAQAERNRQLLNERQPEVRLARLRELQETAADPKRARPFLLRSSMIESLEKAAAAA